VVVCAVSEYAEAAGMLPLIVPFTSKAAAGAIVPIPTLPTHVVGGRSSFILMLDAKILYLEE